MEFAQGGDLFNAVQQAKTHKMNEPMARYFFQQLIAGIGYMHSQVGRACACPKQAQWTDLCQQLYRTAF